MPDTKQTQTEIKNLLIFILYKKKKEVVHCWWGPTVFEAKRSDLPDPHANLALLR